MINQTHAHGPTQKIMACVESVEFPSQSWAESCFPGLEASSKPAQHLDARVEMCERVVRVMTSIAEHMNKIEWSEDLRFR